MLRHLRTINALEISVGVAEPKTHTGKGDSVSMADLYHWQDQGTRTIPARETLKPAVRAANKRELTMALVRGAATGGYRDAMREGGESMAKAVKVEIMRIKSPALKPNTIRNRVNGGTNPLVDTGQLIRSIGSVVK